MTTPSPKPREVAGLRGTTQLVSSHTLTFEIVFGGQLQTARDRRSTGLQRTFSISELQTKVDKTATSPRLNGCTAGAT